MYAEKSEWERARERMLKVNRALIYHVDNEMHWNNVAINNTNCITKSTYFLSPFCNFSLLLILFVLLCALTSSSLLYVWCLCTFNITFLSRFYEIFSFLIVCTVLLSVSYFFLILFLHSLDLIIYLENFHITCFKLFYYDYYFFLVINFIIGCYLIIWIYQ